MKLDRAYQLELLNMLSESYPSPFFDPKMGKGMDADQKHRYVANMCYLAEHGLVESGVHPTIDGLYSLSSPSITAKGMDFLADDGGLSAILGTVTIKFHDDALKALIETKIMTSEIDPQDKKKWSDALRELPAESTKHLTMKLLDSGLAHAPDALRLIQTALSQFS
jgi:hypothetical protein